MLDGSFQILARIALSRLNVKWEPSQLEIEYNLNRITQIPIQNQVNLKSRFSRKIEWNGMKLKYV